MPQANIFRVITTRFAVIILTFASSFQAVADEIGMKMHGDLVIENAWIRAAPAGAPVAGGYLKITNKGQVADTLVSVSAEFAGMSEIHEMAMEGDVMKMQMLPDGLGVPAGGEVLLKPGSYHVMLIGMKRTLKLGDTFTLDLRFEKSGDLTVQPEVREP